MKKIAITQIDERILVEVDGKELPDIFTGYEIKSSKDGVLELSLKVKERISILETQANLAEPRR